MLEVIGIIFVGVIGFGISKVVLYRIFPEYGLKVAERRYTEDPDSVNERLLWEARRRVRNK